MLYLILRVLKLKSDSFGPKFSFSVVIGGPEKSGILRPLISYHTETPSTIQRHLLQFKDTSHHAEAPPTVQRFYGVPVDSMAVPVDPMAAPVDPMAGALKGL